MQGLTIALGVRADDAGNGGPQAGPILLPVGGPQSISGQWYDTDQLRYHAMVIAVLTDCYAGTA